MMLNWQSGLWSHVLNWCEETMMYRVVYGLMYGIGMKRPCCCIQIEWSLVSCMKLVRKDHDVYTEWSMVSCMELVWRDHGVVDRVVHGLIYGISEKRPWCWIDSGLWSHVLNWCEETMMYIQWSMVSCMNLVRRDHDVYTEWSMVSCMKLVRRDHDVV